MVSFEIFNNNNDYRVLVKAQDKIEFMTDEYGSRTQAIEAINRIRRNAQRYDSYKLIELECGSWLYQLYDMSSNTLLGYSQSYISRVKIESKVKEMRILLPFAKFNSATYSSEVTR